MKITKSITKISNLQFNPRLQLLTVISFLLIGSILRLIWAADMEWKYDEKSIFELSQQIASGSTPWPVSGFPSSVLVRIPGMSVWCFAVIAKFAHDPIAMVRWVQWLNVITIWLFFGFILWQIAKEERHTWLWGLAIMSVNPLAILLSRRIWQPDILAPFCFLVLLGHWFRRKFWGSFLWGFVAILTGQVQMGGFFLVIGLFLWTVWHEYKQKILRKTAWVGWFLGTAIGFLPLIPWLWEVLPQMESYRRSIVALLVPKFYSQWVTTALGVNLSFTLKDFFWQDFLREPSVFGIPTYLMIPAHLFLVGIGLYPLYRWLKKKQNPPLTPPRRGTGSSPDEKNPPPGDESRLFPIPDSRFPIPDSRFPIPDSRFPIPHSQEPKLSFYLKALGFGVGGAFTLSRVNVHPYYIAIAFPFIYLWLAGLYRNKIKILLAIALVQLLISLTFLVYVHRTGGMPYCGAGYGVSYRFQVEKGIPCNE
ncbi:MAG: hypothetical protein F6J96_19215 [Symploca sp. SIO1C2]|nr:hypothetical protein [Symploca sp. SIO1C2]